MPQEPDVSIYMRRISLEIVVPRERLGEFLLAFGDAFAIEADGEQEPRAIDRYYPHPSGWHVVVTLWQNEEAPFYAFLRQFCTKSGLLFREPKSPSSK